MIGTIIVLNVRSQCPVADRTGFVVDLVLGVDQITTGEAKVLSTVCGIVRCLTLDNCSLGGAGVGWASHERAPCSAGVRV